jgi:hypothetical protein
MNKPHYAVFCQPSRTSILFASKDVYPVRLQIRCHITRKTFWSILTTLVQNACKHFNNSASTSKKTQPLLIPQFLPPAPSPNTDTQHTSSLCQTRFEALCKQTNIVVCLHSSCTVALVITKSNAWRSRFFRHIAPLGLPCSRTAKGTNCDVTLIH